MGMKMCVICLLLLTLVLPAFAQDQAPSADDIVSKMQAALNLTSDQVSAITPIIEKYASQREELRQSVEDGTADRDSVRSQMKELRESEKQDLSQVLSSDQLSQWEKLQAQGKHHKHGSDSSGGEGSSGDNGGASTENSGS